MENTLASDMSKSGHRHQWRMLKDRLFGVSMAVGGITVIVALLLIFFYLLYVVIPLFKGASVRQVGTIDFPVRDVALLSLDEYAEVGLSVTRDGQYQFFSTATGADLYSGAFVGGSQPVDVVAGGYRAARTLAIGFRDGTALVARPTYTVGFPNNQRQITPRMSFPLGETPIAVTTAGEGIQLIAAESAEAQTTIATWSKSGQLVLTNVALEKSFLDEESTQKTTRITLPIQDREIAHLLMDIDQNELYAVSRTGALSYFDIRDKQKPILIAHLQVVESGLEVTSAEFLSGGISLLIGDSSGRVVQWFPVRDKENNYRVERIREFKAFSQKVTAIEPEYFRKGFAALDAAGNLGLFHATAERVLLVLNTGITGIHNLAMAPRADAIGILDQNNRFHFYRVTNNHPEVSWRSLWGRVWYEGRDAPQFIWQSSSASSDFEPKFSLTPLTFGTFKAAFYALAFAIPIAIFGAIYTAYFMNARVRSFVKPSIEIMAALPSVILGFLAGLWVAPLIELHLIGVFAVTFGLPFVMLLVAYAWSRLPARVRGAVPDGYEALLLVPVVCGAIWLALSCDQVIEAMFFGGNLPLWLSTNLGIDYDQRNSLVVGMAMGFAVIPIIFSISEDAVFSVPQHLTNGSLALGATPWQTVTRVVLLTASPGIFSAVMIGLGRAVGETMIVLMATGNTPVIDFSIFQGFRALSANIAVEMPESAVNSTHYRVLFLAALVLFLITFTFNTLAEIVRQRLRVKYSNL